MKTAISLPDKVHRDADRLARRLGKSRSRVYTEAIQLYLARYDSDAVTDGLNAVCDATSTGLDAGLQAASAGTLARSEW
jgi:predicted transcriptional regulator